MSISRALFDSLEYSFDAPTEVSRSWVALPLNKAVAQGAVRPRETPQVANMINGEEALAHVENRLAIPFAEEPTDTFLNPLVTASNDLTPVWVRVVSCGQSTGFEIGGSRGCLVAVTKGALPEFGELGVSMAAFMTTACGAGDTFSTFAAGS